MTDRSAPHFSSTLPLETLPGEGISRIRGTTVPTDGTAGYVTGCLFMKSNGGVGSTLYVNEGSNTSCDFNAK